MKKSELQHLSVLLQDLEVKLEFWLVFMPSCFQLTIVNTCDLFTQSNADFYTQL